MTENNDCQNHQTSVMIATIGITNRRKNRHREMVMTIVDQNSPHKMAMENHSHHNIHCDTNMAD
jgi:hypothetical protein